MDEKETESLTTTPSDDNIQISKEDFSKLSYRQKFAVTEYGYLLSVEDADVVGKMLGSITNEKDVLAYCRAKGKKVLRFDKSLATTDTVENSPSIGLIGFLAGLIPGLIMFGLLSAIGFLPLGICSGFGVIILGLIGAETGKRNKRAAWISAVLFAIIGAILISAILGSLCIWCI